VRHVSLRRLKSIALALVCLLAAHAATAKAPDGWPFVEFNEAVRTARQLNKPMYVYFGFETCPYCVYANQHTFSSAMLRKFYTDHYVLAYFDIRGNPDDPITLPTAIR
jgi:thioredoxin-related protein